MKKFKTFKKYKMFFIPFLMFFCLVSLDLISTYIGVCLKGHIELNDWSVMIASKYGYLALWPMILFEPFIFSVVVWVTDYIFTKRLGISFFRAFLLALLFLIGTIWLPTLANNWGNVANEYIGEEVFETEGLVEIPTEYMDETIEENHEMYMVHEIGELFEPHRKNFCRLI